MIRILRRFLRCESGTATIELVIILPMIFTLFAAAMESGLLMTRSALLDRALDLTVRELRLGHVANPSHDDLKQMICDRFLMVQNCMDNLMLELRKVDMTTWVMPAEPATCVDRNAAVQPVTELDLGQHNDLMLVRACLMADLIFPTSQFGAQLAPDAQGGFGLVAVSAFVNEPM
jgi:Flp pilus assembly protein TadG